ncbi:hypothetical protein NS44R_14970 [Mammaliicoccus sciuri]|nr:hypothetical protein NS44R_14970 [Mammaliicoccus sciuri]
MGPEQPIEMRSRQPGLARDRVELDLGAGAFGHQPDRFTDAEIGHRGGGGGAIGRLPALLVAGVDQLPELAIEAA